MYFTETLKSRRFCALIYNSRWNHYISDELKQKNSNRKNEGQRLQRKQEFLWQGRQWRQLSGMQKKFFRLAKGRLGLETKRWKKLPHYDNAPFHKLVKTMNAKIIQLKLNWCPNHQTFLYRTSSYFQTQKMYAAKKYKSNFEVIMATNCYFEELHKWDTKFETMVNQMSAARWEDVEINQLILVNYSCTTVVCSCRMEEVIFLHCVFVDVPCRCIPKYIFT